MDPGLWRFRGKLVRPKIVHVAKQSHISEMSHFRPGSRAHLRTLKALDFLVLKYVFSNILQTLFSHFMTFSWTSKDYQSSIFVRYGSDYCHGMTESVKIHRKDQSVKDFTSKCLFLLFWPISCISLIFLIEIWSFCKNLLENYPAHKIDQLPLLRILSLCMDHSMQTRINSLYPFLLFLFTLLVLSGQNDVRIHALVWQ